MQRVCARQTSPIEIACIKTAQARVPVLLGQIAVNLNFLGGIMNSSPSQSLGQWIELAGAGAFIAGAILSLHHYAIGICFIAGAAAFYVGKKMRAA